MSALTVRVRPAAITLMLTMALAALAGPVHGKPFPAEIALPPGFGPEGIAIGPGHTFYVGSIPTGDIFRGDLRTGDGDVFSSGGDGDAAIGLALDDLGRLFVAGGPTGGARIIDAATGELLASFTFTEEDAFINDVVVTESGAYFTDSFSPVLYRVSPDLTTVDAIDVTGDFTMEEGFNLNGIDATPDGSTLLLVQSNTGSLFTADPVTGVATLIDLGEQNVQSGDGILLHGRQLYVVQNFLNQVAVVQLEPDLSAGTITELLTADGFDVPTTIARFGSRLYAANARFTTPPTDTTPYWVTRFER